MWLLVSFPNFPFAFCSIKKLVSEEKIEEMPVAAATNKQKSWIKRCIVFFILQEPSLYRNTSIVRITVILEMRKTCQVVLCKIQHKPGNPTCGTAPVE